MIENHPPTGRGPHPDRREPPPDVLHAIPAQDEMAGADREIGAELPDFDVFVTELLVGLAVLPEGGRERPGGADSAALLATTSCRKARSRANACAGACRNTPCPTPAKT